MTVSDLINTVVSQISQSFPDQDREATTNDIILIWTTTGVIAKAFLEKEQEAGR